MEMERKEGVVRFEKVVRLEKSGPENVQVIKCCKPWGHIRPIDEESRKDGKLIHGVGISVRVVQEGGRLRVRRRGNLIVIKTVFKI